MTQERSRNEAINLAFDWGTSIVGILEIDAGVYTPYRSMGQMVEAALLLTQSRGTIVSFNGNGRDLHEICELLHVTRELKLCGRHDDMSEIVSRIRWPPDPDTAPILGENLIKTYRYYFGTMTVSPPADLRDDYELSNWSDCYMTAELWKMWRRGELKP